MVSWGFLGAKAPLQSGFAKDTAFFSAKAQKLQTVCRIFMEESWFGFLIAGGLCSKPGRSLCERINLDFTTAPGCLHSLSLGRHDHFGRLCNQFLPKTLRFSLQRHKAQEFCKAEFLDSLPVSCFASENSCFRNSPEQKLKNSAKQNSWIVCRFSPWYAFSPVEPAICIRIQRKLNS